MADTIMLFPSNKIEALAFLYVQNLDMSTLSPKDLMDKYNEVHKEIHERNKETRPKRSKPQIY